MQRYLDTRTVSPTMTTGADLARHLLSRQHLGKTIIVCDKPAILMSVVRKYWLRLARGLQRERSSTLNAERILQLTYDITHMQHMQFVTRTFREAPRADVFFVTPHQLDEQLPEQCYTCYIVEPVTTTTLEQTLSQLPQRSLIIDYTHTIDLTNAMLLPKRDLEQLLPTRWAEMQNFLTQQHVDLASIAEHAFRAQALDEALDNLLSVSNQFMHIADDFLELLRLAQPVVVPNSIQQQYELLATLNRRITALTPGTMSQQFIQSLAEDDDLSLHDWATENLTLAYA